MKKKLIFITEALWIGGIETALVNLLNRLDYDRYDVTCLILRDEQDMAARITPRCRFIVSDRRRAVSFKEPYRYNRIYTLMEEPQNASKFRRLIWRALVLLLRAPEAKLYASYVKHQLGREHFDTAVIYSDRTAETAVRAINADKFLMFYHDATIRKAYHDKMGYEKSEKIIAVSEQKAEDIKKFRPRYADKIITIHNIVDIAAIIKASEEKIYLPFSKHDFNIVTCGRLAYQKAIDWAIVACKSLLNDGYNELQWWIVGGGPDEIELSEQINAAGVGGHFHLLGMQSNPYPYIKQADLYVQPSRYENYSVAILEAMALCKPILATIPAADQQIKDGLNGMLCEPNPQAIANAIGRLMRNPHECDEFVCYLKNNSLEDENCNTMGKLDILL